MILVDTSVWIDHLRAGNERLGSLLAAEEVLVHPYVVGEIALGHWPQREATLRMLRRLPQAATASHDEVLDLIDRLRLHGRGIGYVDVHVLAAVRLTPDATLWSRDARLHRVAAELGVAAMLPH